MSNKRLYKGTKAILFAGLIILSLLYLLRPIIDFDFFWQIKTGEWIWENKSLLFEDPFRYTDPSAQIDNKNFVLNQHWISQIIYHLFFLAGGIQGIIFLRFIFFGAFLYTILKLFKGDAVLYLGLVIMFLVFFLESYPLDRSQVFSFLFFAALLYYLDKIKEGAYLANKKRLFFLMPLLMLVWANMHGGFILGQAVILIYIISEGFKFIRRSLKPLEKKIYVQLISAGVLGIVFSFLNPAGYDAWIALTSKSHAYMNIGNIEYMSSLERFNTLGGERILLFWVMMMLAFIGAIINIKKTDITEVVLLAGTGYFALVTVRYIPFFMLASLPLISKYLSRGSIQIISRIFILSFALLGSLYFASDEKTNIQNIKSGLWIDYNVFPIHATDFIIEKNVRGRMFNNYEWGGYFLWRLFPGQKVFIDGRFLSLKVYREYQGVMDPYAFMEGLPYWKTVLETHGVTYIIIPLFQQTGRMLSLFDFLVQDDDWIPVFFSENSMIFVKNIPENSFIINNYSFGRDHFLESLIRTCERQIQYHPGHIPFYMARSKMYMLKGNYPEARKGYERVLEFSPGNTAAINMLKLIDSKK